MHTLPEPPEPQRLQSLAEIEQAVWQELERCVQERGHEWRTPVLATSHFDEADARTVVLREVYAEHRELLIYTDARSRKVTQMLAQPRGVLVMWRPALGWQLRCRAMLSAEVGGLAVSSRWAQLGLTPGAHDYLSPLPPGTALEHPPEPPTPSRELPPRHHFAIISAQIESVDWLELHRDGHRRALFDAQGARWLQP